MDERAALLAKLRDIHLPPDPSWWPPAPGWWILGLVLLAAAAGGLALWWRGWVRRAPRRAALRVLKRLESEHRAGAAPLTTLIALSELMRRAALARGPRESVAALTGRRWLAFLDQGTEPGRFTDGPARVLARGPYQREAAPDLPPVIEACRDWLRHNA